jgi:hypothetical protein
MSLFLIKFLSEVGSAPVFRYKKEMFLFAGACYTELVSVTGPRDAASAISGNFYFKKMDYVQHNYISNERSLSQRLKVRIYNMYIVH